MTRIPLSEIATRINAYLNRFEADPQINKKDGTYRTSPYYMARSWASGRYVYVSYVGYQGRIHLPREQAEKYLSWLDAGNVGKHWKAVQS